MNKVNEFVEYLRSEEKSKATIEKYSRDVRVFLVFMKHRELNKMNVLKYKEELIKTYKIASVNSMLAAVNIYLSFINRNDCRVKLFKLQSRMNQLIEKELTKEEYLRLLDVASKRDEKVFFLTQLICSTGIRVSELKFITVDSLYSKRTKVNSKGKTRDIVIPLKLVDSLIKYCKSNRIYSGHIFITKKRTPLDRSNIWRMMKKLCEEAEVDEAKVFPHNLRYLFSLTYYQIEKDIVRLADILGHSNIETTRIYTKTSSYDYQEVFDRMNLYK